MKHDAVRQNDRNGNGGKAFIDFIVSKEAQEVVVKAGRRSVRTDVPANPALVPLSDVPDAKYDFKWAADNRARLMEKWNETLLDVQ